jgi:hypothetical protein
LVEAIVFQLEIMNYELGTSLDRLF